MLYTAACAWILLVAIFWGEWHNKKATDLEHCGIYYLTSYPNCGTCKIRLLENELYEVHDGNKVLEKGDWHSEDNGDFLTIYLNGEKDRLGYGKYAYNNRELIP